MLVNFFLLQGEATSLSLSLCLLDGLESCQRGVHLSSSGCTLSLHLCYVTDMFSLVRDEEQERNRSQSRNSKRSKSRSRNRRKRRKFTSYSAGDLLWEREHQ